MNEDQTPGAGAPPDPAAPGEGSGPRSGSLDDYLGAHAGRYTDEALREAAVGVGWDPASVDEALARIHARESDVAFRARARRIVGWLYLAAWSILSAGMAANPVVGGGLVLLVGILTVSMLIAYGIGRLWMSHVPVGPRLGAGDMAVVLVVPVVLWLTVAGICVAAILPPRAA